MPTNLAWRRGRLFLVWISTVKEAQGSLLWHLCSTERLCCSCWTSGLPHLVSQSVSQFSPSVVSNSLRLHEPQHTRPPCPSPTPGVYPNSCPLSQWCHPAISSSVIPYPLDPNPSQHQGLFQWANSSHQVAKVLEFQVQHQSFQWIFRTDLQDGVVGSPCSPRDYLEPVCCSMSSSNCCFLTCI